MGAFLPLLFPHPINQTRKIRNRKGKERRVEGIGMGSGKSELYFVFMNYDPEYERLLSNRGKGGENEVEMYLSKKHDKLLARKLEAGSYNKTFSLLIVDAFAVQITDQQANVLRSAKEVRLVEKNQELS